MSSRIEHSQELIKGPHLEVVYHLQKNSGSSGSFVNGTRLFDSFPAEIFPGKRNFWKGSSVFPMEMCFQRSYQFQAIHGRILNFGAKTRTRQATNGLKLNGTSFSTLRKFPPSSEIFWKMENAPYLHYPWSQSDLECSRMSRAHRRKPLYPILGIESKSTDEWPLTTSDHESLVVTLSILSLGFNPFSE